MRYVIGFKKQDTETLFVLIRRYLGDYRAIDRIEKTYRTYDGRITCSGLLTFETIERAKIYAENNIQGEYSIYKYDPCMNAIIVNNSCTEKERKLCQNI